MIFAFAITGPTASGKTGLSLDIARELGCEIISCDSMQIYKGMDIGTAKATEEERKTVPHHLIDIIDPDESYSAENYREDALRVASEIVGRGKTPLFVGGTGMYLDTVSRGTSPLSPPSSPEIYERLLKEAETDEGKLSLYRRLARLDRESAEKIHPNNVRRVVRALEIYELTGKTKSYFDALSQLGERDISVKTVCLDFHDRELLYSRIDRRVDEMFNSGLVDEVRGLYESGILKEDTTAGGAIGYKELFEYFLGQCTLEEAKEEIKLASRRYAKRQLTWFRNKTRADIIYVDRIDGGLRSYNEILAETKELFGGKL